MLTRVQTEFPPGLEIQLLKQAKYFHAEGKKKNPIKNKFKGKK